MPCDSISETTVDLGKVDSKLAALAAAQAGYSVRHHESGWTATRGRDRINFGARGAEVTTSGDETAVANEFKASYATEVVKSAANRFGWAIKETKPKVGQRAFVINKRR